MFGNEEIYFQQDWAPLHDRIETTHPHRWFGRRVSVEFLSRSPDLISMDFFLWDYLKDKSYRIKPAMINELKEEIVRQCLTVPDEMLRNVV